MRPGFDIRIPADPQDFETTESRTSLPPLEFSVEVGDSSNIFSITDRQFPAQRGPTVSYRIYFLPAAFGDVDTISRSSRIAGQRVASLVAEVAAPGRGTVLTVTDTQFFGQSGNYYCVGVSRRGIEGPPENFVRIG